MEPPDSVPISHGPLMNSTQQACSRHVRQFRALLWKNWILRRRSPFLLIAEIAFPLIFVCILAAFRCNVPVYSHPACHIRHQALPSMGMAHYIRSLVCNFNYTCHPFDPDEPVDEEPEQRLLRDLAEVLSNERLRYHLFAALNDSFSFTEFMTDMDKLPSTDTLTSIFYLLSHIFRDDPDLPTHLLRIRQSSSLVCGSESNDIYRLFTKMDKYIDPHSTAAYDSVSDTCATLKSVVNSSLMLNTMGRIRYFLFGQIAYYPSTPFTDAVVREANKLYSTLETLKTWLRQYNPESSVLSKLTRRLPQWHDYARLCEDSFFLPEKISSLCTFFTKWSQPVNNQSTTTRMDRVLNRTIHSVLAVLDCMRLTDRYIPFQNETDMNAFLQADHFHLTRFGVIFEHLSHSPHLSSIVIRANPFLIDTTFRYRVLDNYWYPSPRRSPESEMKYFTSGFIDLQESLSRAILSLRDPHSTNVGTVMKPFPTAPYSDRSFLELFGPHLPQFIILAWSLTVVACVKYLVDEREQGLMEIFRILRVPSCLTHLSWFAVSLAIVLTTAIPMILVLKHTGVVPNTDLMLLFAFFLSYTLALLAFALLCSQFFTRSNLAAVTAGGMYFMCCLPGPILLHFEHLLPSQLFMIASLLPQVSYSFGWAYIFRLELHGSGARWSNMWHSGTAEQTRSLGFAFLSLWFTILAQLAVALWLIPFVKQCYLLMLPHLRRYCFCSNCAVKRNKELLATNSIPVENLVEGSVYSRRNETPRPSVLIQHLCKRFYHSNLVLDHINLRFFPDEVCTLLGRNGAGKTTLFSILAGVSQPTSGRVLINGQKVNWNFSSVQPFLGYCPQQDILYPRLTVSEHIRLYAHLKGFDTPLTKQAVLNHVHQFGFHGKQDCLVSDLSGGQRRKLSVCLAFLGCPPSSIILLDEPTTGLDPLSKRLVWDAILSLKFGRTVILTSHHMREADFLSDRLAFLAQGRVHSSGSSVSLKSQYGQGYLLLLEKNNCTIATTVDGAASLLPTIRTCVPEAVLINDSPSHVLVRLPPSGALDGQFVSLFRYLESQLLTNTTAFPVDKFSLTDCSLDDLFVTILGDGENGDTIDGRLASRSSEMLPLQDKKSESNGSTHLLHTYLENGGTCKHKIIPPGHRTYVSDFLRCLYFQSKILAYVRFCHIKRNKRVWIFEFFIPTFLLFLALILFSLYHPQTKQPIMDLNPWLMTYRRDRNQVFFLRREPCNQTSEISSSAIQNASLWTGTRCLSSHIQRPHLGGTCSAPVSPWPRTMSCSSLDRNSSLNPRQRRLPTGDLLVDLTDFNVTTHILSGASSGESYGGLSFMSRTVLDPFSAFLNSTVTFFSGFDRNQSDVEGTDLDADLLSLSLPPLQQVQIWYNNKGFVSAPAFLNILHNMQLRLHNNYSSETSAGLIVASHPQPFPENNWFLTLRETMLFEAAFAPFLIIALTAVISNFAIPLVRDRHSGLKHLQLVSGLQPYVYWSVNFACDFTIYVLVSVSSTVLLAIFQRDAFIHRDVIGLFFMVVLLYGTVLTLWVYLLTFFFNHPSTAFVVIGAVNVFLCSITLSVDMLLRLLLFYKLDKQTLFTTTMIRRTMLAVLPHHCFASSILDLTVMGFVRNHAAGSRERLLRKFPLLTDQSWSLLQLQILCLFVQNIVLFLVLLVVEYHRCGWNLWESLCSRFWKQTRNPKCSSHSENETFLHPANQPMIDIRHLSKRYRGQTRPALDKLTLSVQAGECFGLLGTNGAGKSTTFGLLSGHFPVRQNTVFMKGIDFSTRLLNRQSGPSIGYCPQRDALHPFLNAWETLWLYGQLRGLSGPQLTTAIDHLIQSLGLQSYSHQLVRTYSGGTRRKLSTAVAFMGDPDIILLDEPSGGMDPSARRLLWSMISTAVVQRKAAVLLSSHCMEECEALCHRVGLLIDGQLKCVGKPSDLKLQFNLGYRVDFELSDEALSLDAQHLQYELNKILPTSCQLSFPLYTRQQFTCDGSVQLSELFSSLSEACNDRHLLRRFSVKRSTLEDAFIQCISVPPVV